jgi:hypothetical protein
MDSLSKQALVFSISHDQSGVRVYEYYAMMGERWTYYRYLIQEFTLRKLDDVLIVHSFVRNILKSHLSKHTRRLKDAIIALPDPNEPSESSGLSFMALGISLNDDNPQQDSQDRDGDGFMVPSRPDSSQNGKAKKKGKENESEVVKMLQ